MGTRNLYLSLLFLNTLLMIEGLAFVTQFIFRYIQDDSINLYAFSCLGFGLFIFAVSILGYCAVDDIHMVSFYLSCSLVSLSYQFVFMMQIIVYENNANFKIISQEFTEIYLFGCFGSILLQSCMTFQYRGVLHSKKFGRNNESSHIMPVGDQVKSLKKKKKLNII